LALLNITPKLQQQKTSVLLKSYKYGQHAQGSLQTTKINFAHFNNSQVETLKYLLSKNKGILTLTNIKHFTY